jgi:hypothetical protein
VALRDIAMAALARTTRSPLVEGNAIRILQDGPERRVRGQREKAEVAK